MEQRGSLSHLHPDTVADITRIVSESPLHTIDHFNIDHCLYWYLTGIPYTPCGNDRVSGSLLCVECSSGTHLVELLSDNTRTPESIREEFKPKRVNIVLSNPSQFTFVCDCIHNGVFPCRCGPQSQISNQGRMVEVAEVICYCPNETGCVTVVMKSGEKIFFHVNDTRGSSTDITSESWSEEDEPQESLPLVPIIYNPDHIELFKDPSFDDKYVDGGCMYLSSDDEVAFRFCGKPCDKLITVCQGCGTTEYGEMLIEGIQRWSLTPEVIREEVRSQR